MNGTTRVSFDTCAVVKLIGRQYDLASLGIDVDSAEQYVSVIARMESLAKPLLPPEEERDIRAFLAGIRIASITPEVEECASKLKLPDCIIAATAVISNSTLLTDDDGLLNLQWPGYTVQAIL